MARLYLFAEGQTEQTFADTVLKPHLASFKVYLHNPVLVAHARKKGRVHRGGGRNYQAMANDIRRFTLQEKGEDVFFTTMIDLYAIHHGFPGLAHAESLRHVPYDRVRCLEQAWEADIADPRFIPFIQLHEFEAYLFCKPNEFELFYDDAEGPIAKLCAIADAHSSPELIDDGQDSAPSKRIGVEFPDYARAKAAIAPQIGELIGVAAIREKCPHFHQWLAALEGLFFRTGGPASNPSC